MKSTYKKLTLQGSGLPPTAPGLSLARSEVTHFFEHSLGSFENLELSNLELSNLELPTLQPSNPPTLQYSNPPFQPLPSNLSPVNN